MAILNATRWLARTLRGYAVSFALHFAILSVAFFLMSAIAGHPLVDWRWIVLGAAASPPFFALFDLWWCRNDKSR